MAEYRVTGPDGAQYKVTGPDGATDEQVLSQVKAYKPAGAAPAGDPKAVPDQPAAAAPAAPPAQPVPPPVSAGGDSTAGFISGNLLKGIGTLAGSPVDAISGAINLGSMGNDILRAPMRGFAPGNWQPPIQNPVGGGEWFRNKLTPPGSSIDRQSEPQSTGGRYAAAALQMAPGAMLGRPTPAQLPRALGATTTSGLASEAARDIVGDEWAGIGAMLPGAFKMQPKAPGARATEARKAEAFGKARDMGIPVPPSSLKADKAQQAVQNAGNKELRQPEGTEFTPKTLQNYRNAAFGDYEAVMKAPALKGGVVPTQKFQQEVQAIGSEIESARQSLPETFKGMKPVIKLLSEYGYAPMPQGKAGSIQIPPRQKPIPPDVAMRAVKKLRQDASTNFASDNPEKVEMARVQKRLANSIDDMIEENLSKTGDQALVGKYKEARTAIAKSHDYEAAMEPGGRINAAKLAAMQNEGAPLTGGTQDIAQVAGAFPGAVGKPKDETMFTQKTSPMAITHPPAVMAHQVPKWYEKGLMTGPGQAMIDPRGKLTPQQQQMIRYLSAINAQNRANQIPSPP